MSLSRRCATAACLLLSAWPPLAFATTRVDASSEEFAYVQLAKVDQTLELYKFDNGQYPTHEQGLLALVEAPTTEPLPPPLSAARLPGSRRPAGSVGRAVRLPDSSAFR